MRIAPSPPLGQPIWRDLLIRTVLFLAVLVTAILLIVTVERAYFTDPPLSVVPLNDSELGLLCPGDYVPLRNFVTVDQPSVLYYVVSTMDVTETYNFVGTQVVYMGFTHPREGQFNQLLPWSAPPLGPGSYKRVFAAHSIDGTLRPVFVSATYSIGDLCNE